MALFDHLKSREIVGKKKWLHVPQVNPACRLELLPASEVNKAYNNASLKAAGARVQTIATTGRGKARTADPDKVNEGVRDDDRRLYSQYVITGWTGVLDVDGNEVEFDREVAAEFFQALPAWIFDRIRLFCVVPENFVDDDEGTIDTEALTGNSESDSAGS